MDQAVGGDVMMQTHFAPQDQQSFVETQLT